MGPKGLRDCFKILIWVIIISVSAAERISPTKAKKQIKQLAPKKKEEIPAPSPSRAPPSVQETSTVVFEKPLQTTNQVKANLISANMIKGDMILTKPGQARNNQKVMFVQKKMPMKVNELRTVGLKKHPILLTKGGKSMQMIQTKLCRSADGKFVPIGGKFIAQTIASQLQQSSTPVNSLAPLAPVIVQEIPTPSAPSPPIEQQPLPPSSPVSQQSQTVKPAVVATPPVKVKTPEVKKEKKKSESESTKIEETTKSTENLSLKTPDVKKHVKKDPRKVPAVFANALGPALFSTPDIIRRVSSGSEPKGPETPVTPTTLTVESVANSTIAASPQPMEIISPSTPIIPTKIQDETPSMETQISQEEPSRPMDIDTMKSVIEDQSLQEINNDHLKSETKVPTEEELHASLDPGEYEFYCFVFCFIFL